VSNPLIRVLIGGRNEILCAQDAKTAKELWKTNLGGSIVMAPIVL
jgi:hypothetical protein